MSFEILKQVYNSFDPFEPADGNQYLDCSPACGGGVFLRDLSNHLRIAGDKICTLFTGHIGSGKSSELEHVRRQLSQSRIDGKRYFPVLVDAQKYLDEFDADTVDLFLAMVTELASTLKAQTGIVLEDGYFSKKLGEVKNLMLNEVELAEGQVSLFGNKAKIRLLKQDSEIRAAVRARLGAQPASLLNAVNEVFDTARKKLSDLPSQKRCHDLVLIVDNLEKVQVIGKKGEGIESQSELYIERAPQLTRLNTHVIYTVPLRLAREFGPQLGLRYDQDPFVLPMVMLRKRSSSMPNPEGVACLKEMLAARIGTHHMADIFQEDALDFLIQYSGGNPRHLMMFAQNACANTELRAPTI